MLEQLAQLDIQIQEWEMFDMDSPTEKRMLECLRLCRDEISRQNTTLELAGNLIEAQVLHRANLKEKYNLLADEFRMAVEAGGALFQGKDAPFHDLLKPGQRILVDGFKALANEIERLNMAIEDFHTQGDS